MFRLCIGEEGREIDAQDEQWVHLILEGDSRAFRSLVEKYQTYVFQIAYSVLRHTKDAEDVTQEIFVQLLRSLPDYRRQGLKTWLSRIAMSRSIDYKRKRSRLHEDLTARERMEIAALHPMEPGPERQLLNKERRSHLYGLMHQMPEGYRAIVRAYYLQEKTYREIASEQNMALKTVESKLYRAKKWMRKHWKEEDLE